MKTLIILKHHNNNMIEISKLLTMITPFTQTIDILLIGHNIQDMANNISQFEAVQTIFCTQTISSHMPPIEDIVQHAQELITLDYTYIIMPSSSFSKELLPRLSICNDSHMLSDIIAINNSNTMTYPIYAGNLLRTVTLLDDKKFFSVRLSAIENTISANMPITPNKIKSFDLRTQSQLTRFISFDASNSKRPQLSTAKMIISGGRGLKNKDNFELIFKLADSLHAAVGASRAAVDAEYIGNDFQVGQTGKIVAPNLYIAIGISGAIQHMAGIKDTKNIIAINIDPDAPIIKQCDYYFIGDLFEVIPQLIEKLN